jgi:hypothetical protein
LDITTYGTIMLCGSETVDICLSLCPWLKAL